MSLWVSLELVQSSIYALQSVLLGALFIQTSPLSKNISSNYFDRFFFFYFCFALQVQVFVGFFF